MRLLLLRVEHVPAVHSGPRPRPEGRPALLSREKPPARVPAGGAVTTIGHSGLSGTPAETATREGPGIGSCQNVRGFRQPAVLPSTLIHLRRHGDALRLCCGASPREPHPGPAASGALPPQPRDGHAWGGTSLDSCLVPETRPPPAMPSRLPSSGPHLSLGRTQSAPLSGPLQSRGQGHLPLFC